MKAKLGSVSISSLRVPGSLVMALASLGALVTVGVVVAVIVAVRL